MSELHRRVRRHLVVWSALFGSSAVIALCGAGWPIAVSLGLSAWRTMLCLRADAGLRVLDRRRSAVQAKVAADPSVWIDKDEWALLRLPA